jgi:hypothetical protein
MRSCESERMTQSSPGRAAGGSASSTGTVGPAGAASAGAAATVRGCSLPNEMSTRSMYGIAR